MFLTLFMGIPIAVKSKAADAIQHFVLNEREVIDIGVSQAFVTTVRLPSPPVALDAANVTIDGRTPGAFQLAYQPGASSFAVRALARGAVANVNVLLSSGTFSLRLHESANPVLSVILTGPTKRLTPSPQPFRMPSPSQLIGLLDTAKAYPLLLQHHPEAIQEASSVRSKQVMDYGEFEIRVQEVFRFDQQDALVFRLQMTNKTTVPIRYDPHSFFIRVGARLYPGAISDASGVLPPGSPVPAYVAPALEAMQHTIDGLVESLKVVLKQS
jgi:hypothetical protein